MIRTIQPLPALKDNYMYILSDGDGNCAIVDPSEASPITAFLANSKLRLTHVLCTHHHLDHVGAIPELAKDFRFEVWTSKHDEKRITGASKAVAGIQHLFGEKVEILEVPGHTLGQIAFYFPRLKALFTGDTLFSCGCGRMFEGTYPMFFESLKKLAQLPADTQIYFGHEYTSRNIEFLRSQGESSQPLEDYQRKCELAGMTTPTMLFTELQLNPFLRAESVEEFSRWREARNSW